MNKHRRGTSLLEVVFCLLPFTTLFLLSILMVGKSMTFSGEARRYDQYAQSMQRLGPTIREDIRRAADCIVVGEQEFKLLYEQGLSIRYFKDEQTLVRQAEQLQDGKVDVKERQAFALLSSSEILFDVEPKSRTASCMIRNHPRDVEKSRLDFKIQGAIGAASKFAWQAAADSTRVAASDQSEQGAKP